jgi:hypothetical protein
MIEKRILLAAAFFSTAFFVSGRDIRQFLCTDLAGVPDAGASSRLIEDDNWKKYHESNLFDGNKSTAWVEGVPGYGIGEKIWFSMEPDTEELVFVNGYAQNASLFAKNGRVKTFAFSLWAACNREGMVSEIGPLYEGIEIWGDFTLSLKDTADPQRIVLPVDWKSATHRLSVFTDECSADSQGPVNPVFLAVLEIRDVYPGTHYQDTCVAEIDWLLKKDSSGPGGIRRKDIAGVWFSESGADWESILFEWNPLEQRYSSFLHDRLFDAGSWSFMGGSLILESDGRGMVRQYPKAKIAVGRLELTDDSGNTEKYGRN